MCSKYTVIVSSPLATFQWLTYVTRANIDYSVGPCQLLLLTRRWIVSWNWWEGFKAHALPSVVLFCSRVLRTLQLSMNWEQGNSSGMRKTEGVRGERWVGELDWATLSSVDLLHWSCPSTDTHTQNCAQTRTHTWIRMHRNACTCMHIHTHTHRLKCFAHPLSPWLRPSNGAGSRASLHFR